MWGTVSQVEQKFAYLEVPSAEPSPNVLFMSLLQLSARREVWSTDDNATQSL